MKIEIHRSEPNTVTIDELNYGDLVVYPHDNPDCRPVYMHVLGLPKSSHSAIPSNETALVDLSDGQIAYFGVDTRFYRFDGTLVGRIIED